MNEKEIGNLEEQWYRITMVSVDIPLSEYVTPDI
jgi:hypothetical protein